MSQMYFNPVGGVAFVLIVAVVLFLLLLVSPARRRTTRRQRAVLFAIRAMVLLLLLMAMMRPARVYTEIRQQSATLVVLVDQSRSMLVTDTFGGQSRWEAARSLLADAAPYLAALGNDLTIKTYAFDADLHPIEQEAGNIRLAGEPSGEQTAIGSALEEVLRREGRGRLAGVILLSDGAQRAYAPRDVPPQAAARRLADLGCPLYTFAFGHARGLSQARDLALKDLIANPTVFVKNPLDVSGTLRVEGLANKDISVQLLFETAPGKMEVVAAAKLLATRDGQQLPIELGYTPQTPGEYKVTLQAAPQEGELVTTNNQLSTFVTVLKGGLGALYLEGAFRVEQRAVRDALDTSPDIKLDALLHLNQSRSRWPVNVGDRFEPGRYDVVIIGDLDSSALAAQDWQRLADLVDQGTGLLMLGGFHSFGPGGYGNTALADVLPVEMGRFERQNFGEPDRQDLHVPGPLRMRPAPLGADHPIMHLARGKENARAWARLPRLDGANRFRRLKPNALVLAESDAARPVPLLVAGGWGGGRVLAFAGDSTWHWPMEGFATEHKRFWRQMVLWLAHKDVSRESRVWIKLDQRRFNSRSRVEFTVGANSPEGEPVADATYNVEVVLPDGARRSVRLVRQGQQLVGTFLDAQQAGDYMVTAAATQGGEPLGEASARFLVARQDLELDNAAADPNLLSSLARITQDVGGAAMAPEELPALLRRLSEQPLDLEIERQTKVTYYDKWPFFLLFVALVSGEWYLRKKWGLV